MVCTPSRAHAVAAMHTPRRDLAAASERAAILQQDLECSHERLAELESSSTDAVERLQRSNQVGGCYEGHTAAAALDPMPI